jgi:hypothetical protein
LGLKEIIMFGIKFGLMAELILGTAAAALGAGAAADTTTNQPPKVTLLRIPDRGIQPQVAVDSKGVVHLIYFKGDPAAGDIFYVHSESGEIAFSRPLRVNSYPGSAIAVGNIRGAHLAVGKKGRVHVAWNGTGKAEPKGPKGALPMLYTRLNDAGTAFEPQRNIIQSAFGLDGGGSVAADESGNVYVAWHAPAPGSVGEGQRRVWIAHSSDEGQSFSRETPAYSQATGACGCCGLRAFADSKGSIYLLYRAATEQIHRDMYLLISTNQGAHFQGEDISPWEINTCPMTTASFAQCAAGVLASWETNGQVYYVRIDSQTGQRSQPVAAPGSSRGRKFPAVAGNAKGETILVWTEGMGWNRGGRLAWQIYDQTGKPTSEKGTADGVPTWSLVAAFVRPDGGFTVIY